MFSVWCRKQKVTVTRTKRPSGLIYCVPETFSRPDSTSCSPESANILVCVQAARDSDPNLIFLYGTDRVFLNESVALTFKL